MKPCRCVHKSSADCLRADHNARAVFVICDDCGTRQRGACSTTEVTPCIACGGLYATGDGQ